jgi:LytS/YehU family sensor histidine kinase
LPGTKGIGLINVKKRLDLIYPGKHVLEIESTTNSYRVHLHLELQRVSMAEPIFEETPKLQLA